MTSTPITVRLTCGHTWRESRPEGLADPVQGELRACGHPEHYPMQFPASYEQDDETDSPEREVAG